ncbi:MAG: DUF4435 domain-containing protein [Muribaculaceae bacterium]|nr:DUF4435 domain-containing protein [Muribaculaceae bacterium]
MILPPRTDNQPSGKLPPSRRVVIVGANGAGKTRFAERMAADSDDRPAFRMSALRALYDTRPPAARQSDIDGLYPHTGNSFIETLDTELERLIALLMHDEMVNLFRYKAANSDTQRPATLPATKLDKVMELWKEVFPGNRILVESGKMLFSRENASEYENGYSSVKLSDGERAVIYHITAVLYAPRNARVFIDSPEMFLHPQLMQSLWNRIEQLRPDCTFVYVTHNLEFASSRSDALLLWVRSYDVAAKSWDYVILPPGSQLSDELYLAIIGSRKPVLFIEGDEVHSIDARLYPLVFKDYSVKSLGSCNKVIEATRTFNDLNSFHHLDSRGIVDRDRRDAKEVEYLRGRRIMVPDVAEIENILMLEEVIRAVASYSHKDETKVFMKVKAQVIAMFRHDLRQQALMHTRHRVKRTMEYRVDGRFANIGMLEEHLQALTTEINPRGLYENFCRDFRHYVSTGDYSAILRVYNQKSMLPGSNVAALCGMKNKDEYINTILKILRQDGRGAARIRQAITRCFGLDDPTTEENAASLQAPDKMKKKNVKK